MDRTGQDWRGLARILSEKEVSCIKEMIASKTLSYMVLMRKLNKIATQSPSFSYGVKERN